MAATIFTLVAICILLYGTGMILAGDLWSAASRGGEMLVGRRRARILTVPRRRENAMRVIGCCLCLATGYLIAGNAAAGFSSAVSAPPPWWGSALAVLGGLVPPIGFWWLRTAARRARDPDPADETPVPTL